MLRRSADSKNSGDHNWHRLWETPSKKSQRRYTRAWVHQLLGDLPIFKAWAIPKHPVRPSEFTTMTSNPANLAPEDPFLLRRQEMEAKQEQQARKMAELHEQANRLREENERLRTRLEACRAKAKRLLSRTTSIYRRITSYLPTVPRSPAVHHPRTPRKPNLEKGHLV